jgi:hypothetical protein
VKAKFTAAAGQKQLMVWILKNQRCNCSQPDIAIFWLKQARDQTQQSAFAAAVAAHQHPKPRRWDLQ